MHACHWQQVGSIGKRWGRGGVGVLVSGCLLNRAVMAPKAKDMLRGALGSTDRQLASCCRGSSRSLSHGNAVRRRFAVGW